MPRPLSRSALAALAAVPTLALPAAAAPVFTDDFNDNSLDASRWCVYENFPSVLMVDEKNHRLEVSSPSNPAGNARAYINSCGWAFDTTRNFRWKVTYHLADPGFHSGEFGITAACWFEPSPNSAGTPVYNAAAYSVGTNIGGTYAGAYEISDADDTARADLQSNGDEPSLDGTIYFSYKHTEDTLYISTTAYDAADAVAFSGLADADPDTDTAGIALGGFSLGPVFGFSGSNAWFDDLIVNTGITTDPCPADLDRNGTLNLDDISLFADAFFAGEFMADCDNNGILNLDDIICFSGSFVAGCP